MISFYALISVMVTIGLFSIVNHQVSLLSPAFLVILALVFSKKVTNIRWVFFVAILFAIGNLSLLSSPFDAEYQRGFFFLIHMLCPILFLIFRPSKKYQHFMFTYSLLICIFLSVWILWHVVVLNAIGTWLISGLHGSSNILSAHLNFMWPVLLGLAKNKRRGMRYVIYVIVGCSVLSVLMIFSRSALLIAVAMLTYLVVRNKGVVFISFAILLALGASVVFFEAIIEILSSYRLVNYESEYPRTLIWSESWAWIKENPWLGVGPGYSSIALSNLYMYHAHNNIIQVSLEFGLLGGGLLLFFHLYLLKICVKLFFLKHDMGQYLMLAILSYVAYSIAAAPIQKPFLTLQLVFLVVYARFLMNPPRTKVSAT